MRNRYEIPYSSDLQSACWGGQIKNILLENIEAKQAEIPGIISGFVAVSAEGMHIRRAVEDVAISGFKVDYPDNQLILDIPDEIDEYLYDYPESNKFGDVDAGGLWIRHGDRIKLEGIEIRLRRSDPRPAIKQEDVQE